MVEMELTERVVFAGLGVFMAIAGMLLCLAGISLALQCIFVGKW